MERTNEQSRRKFIKDVSILSSTAVLGASVPWLKAAAQGRTAGKGASDRVRLGFIGVGGRGRALLLNCRELENVDIVAVCDNYEPHYKRAIDLADGKAKAFYDYRRMLDEIKDIDAVVIATPLHAHAHITMDYLDAGIHVFCEKSMARTLDDSKRMVLKSKSTGKILQIGHQRMFNPTYLNAFERAAAGEIGQITQIRAYWHRNSDWRRRIPRSELERKINWRLYNEYSAGLMTELASHQLQVANWFLGTLPERVMGSGSISFWKDGREVYDNVACIYDYPDGVKVIYDSVISNKKYGIEEQIMGHLGTIEPEVNKIYSENPPEVKQPPGLLQLINNMERNVFEAVPIGGATWVPEIARDYKGENLVEKREMDDTLLQMEGFVQAVRNNSAWPGLLREGYNATVASLLGLQAMQENRIIEWPEEYSWRKGEELR
jgi:predicted dehydrogenase